MKRNEKAMLEQATGVLRSDVPNEDAITAAARRTAQALALEVDEAALSGAIENCQGVRQMMAPYRAGNLQEARRTLVDAHLRECGSCLRYFREGDKGAQLDWSAPAIRRPARRNPGAWGWALATGFAVLALTLFAYKMYWQVPPGVRAEVQSIDGAAYVTSSHGDRAVVAGASLEQGDRLRTAGSSRAVLRLSDGSLVEMNERSALEVNARGRDMTVALKQGALIVEAAQRNSGHLFVKTPDCRVAVTGTVFSVDAGIKGSRVAVLQGAVRVAYAGNNSTLHPGDQFATSDNLVPPPLDQEFSWSADRQKYIGIVAQLAVVEHRIAQIPFPQPRYSSDLLARMPSGTQLFISIPNLGDFLNQANAIFQDQLNQSAELKAWWTEKHPQDSAKFSDLVAKIHSVSQYLGNEVVVAANSQSNDSGLAVIADVEKSGLKDELQQLFPGPEGRMTVLDPASLATAVANPNPGGYALVRDHEVVFAGSIATLKLMNAQLDAGASGFADSNFGKQISAAYSRGAGIILAANLQSIMLSAMVHAHKGVPMTGMAGMSGMAASGIGDVQYLIAEHREINGVPANHLNLEFTGKRKGIPSWLGSPAPMGSLDYVSPNAAITVATLTKDPAAIADDLMTMANKDWSEIDGKLNISVRNDLMANLNGEFLTALDGPVLPTPSWKVVIGVNNADALESALERMAQAIQSQTEGAKSHQIAIQPDNSSSPRTYTIHDLTTGNDLAVYTFAGGYMIVAPSRALLMQALQTQANGDSLARSATFRSLLPHDANENYSALAYQNLSPVLSPLLSQFSGQAADAIRQLAADARPTVICAWGKESRIEAASDSRLFGFDFLTLAAILHPGNHTAPQSVLQ